MRAKPLTESQGNNNQEDEDDGLKPRKKKAADTLRMNQVKAEMLCESVRRQIK